MDIKKILASGIAVAALSASTALGDDGKVKCRVVNDKGEGVIKEHMAACDTSTHKCNGLNKAGDPESWIWVPSQEVCDKINHGDLHGVPEDVASKLDLDKLNKISDKMKEEMNAKTKNLEKMMHDHEHEMKEGMQKMEGMKDKVKNKMEDHSH